MNRLTFDWVAGGVAACCVVLVMGFCVWLVAYGIESFAHDDAAAVCGKTEVVYAVWERLTPEAKVRLRSPQHVADLMYGGTLKLEEK